MSRRILTKKRFPKPDLQYNNFLVSILINKVLQRGKKMLAQRLVYKALNQIAMRTKKQPIVILEKAVRKVSPRVKLNNKTIGETKFQIPSMLSKLDAIRLSLRWMVEFSKKRAGKSFIMKLANEIMDSAKGIGNSIKRRETIQKTAESSKAFTRSR